MTGTIVTRILKDGSKRYDVVLRVDRTQKRKSFARREDAKRFLTDELKPTPDTDLGRSR